MIVYRVAEGKGWTKDTYAEVTTRGQRSVIQLSNMSPFRAAQGTFEGSDGEIKPSSGISLQVTQDMAVYASNTCNPSTTQA